GADQVDVAIMNDAGTDRAFDSIQAPQSFLIAELTPAARLDRNRVAVADAAADRHKHSVTPQGSRINRAAQSLADPQLLAGLRIVPGQSMREINDQLLFSLCVDDERRAPGTGDVSR